MEHLMHDEKNDAAADVQACTTEQECTQQPWCRIEGTCKRAAAGVEGRKP